MVLSSMRNTVLNVMRNTVLRAMRNTILSAMRNTVFELIKFCQLVPLASGPGVPHGSKHANRPNARKNSQTVQHRQNVKQNLEQTCETWRESPQKGQLGTYIVPISMFHVELDQENNIFDYPPQLCLR